uniref:ATE_C domain-containing protein n=1 Tax=Macrostomum lignano TaxID=282301 RepID=A0A1I8FG51_9PLAT
RISYCLKPRRPLRWSVGVVATSCWVSDVGGGAKVGAGEADLAALEDGAVSGRGRLRLGKARQKRWERLEFLSIICLAAEKASSNGKRQAAASGDGADPETSLKATLSAYRARRAARAAARAPKSLDQMLQPRPRPSTGCGSYCCQALNENSTASRAFALRTLLQMRIHGDSKADCDYRQFYRFLCKSPLPENRLIMVGVVDILPDCTSSVYVFYDPDYAWLNLGTYAALREIQLTKQLGLPHYCMGYYIHDCVKMRYKGAFEGSELLWPGDLHLALFCKPCARPKLDLSGYCRFARPSDVPRRVISPARCQSRRLQVALGHGSANFMPYRPDGEMLSAGHPCWPCMLAELAAEFARLVAGRVRRRSESGFC